MKTKISELLARIKIKIKNIGKKQTVAIAVAMSCIALLVMVSPSLINNTLGSVNNVRQGSASGVTIETPKKVLLGDPSGWEQYQGATIYNWDNFQVTLKNDSASKMTNISVSMTGTGTLTGTSGGTQNFYCTQDFYNELEAGTSETFKCNGVVSDAYNYTDVTETMTISYAINGNIYNDTADIQFYHKVPAINTTNMPVDSNDAVSSEFMYTYTNQSENFYVYFPRSNIYLDISESLENLNLTPQYKSSFGNTIKVEHPQAGDTDSHFGGWTPRMWDYFSYEKAGSGSYKELSTKNSYVDLNHILKGTPTKTTDGTVKVYLPIRAHYIKSGWGGYDYPTNDNKFSISEQPYINLIIYDKSDLSKQINKIQSKLDQLDDDIYNKNEANNAINTALNVYRIRSLSQEDIDNAVLALATYASDDYIPPKKPADYTKLNKKITEAETITNITSVGNHELYTSESWTNLQTVINEVKNISQDYKADEQELVDEAKNKLITAMTVGEDGLVYHEGYFDSIEEALNNLKDKGITIDISSISGRQLEKVKITVDEVEYDYYSESSWNALQLAVNAIDDVINKKADEQQTIEDVATNINTASLGLTVAPADYSKLNKKIEEAKLITNVTSVGNHELYTSSSWIALQSAISAAENLSREYTIEKQSEINTVKTNLETKMAVSENGLVYHAGYYENVESALSLLEEKGISLNLNNLNVSNPKITILETEYNVFSSNTFNELKSVLNTIDINKLANEQSAIEQMATGILQAKDGLVINSELTSIVSLLISEYNGKTKEWYDTEYINEIELKLTDYNNDTDLTKKSVRNVVAELDNLISNMESYIIPADGYNTLETYKQKLNEEKEKTDIYTSSGLSEINNYFQKLESVINNKTYKKSAQDDMNNFIQEIRNFCSEENLKGLKKNGDYSSIDTLLNKIDQLTLTNHANSDYLIPIINNINEHHDYKYDEQSQIDSMYDELLNAYNNLGANYSELNKLINKVNNDIKPNESLYTENTYNSVITEFDNIVYDYKIVDQNKVTTMENKLSKAISLLEYKLADYTVLTEQVAKLPNNYSSYSKSLQNEIKSLLKELDELSDDLVIIYQYKVDNITNKIKVLLEKLSKSSDSSDTTKNITSDIPVEVKNISDNKESSIIKTTSKENNEKSDEKVLKYIKLNGENINLESIPFKVDVKSNVTSASIEVGLYNSKYRYEIYGGQKLAYGENEATIIITDDLNEHYSYVIYINRIFPDNYLSNLEVENSILVFDKTKTEYTIKISKKTNKLNLTAISKSTDAKVTVRGNENLKNGSKVTIEVEGTDGSIRIYTLTVQKPSSIGAEVVFGLIVGLSALSGIIRFLIIPKYTLLNGNKTR